MTVGGRSSQNAPDLSNLPSRISSCYNLSCCPHRDQPHLLPSLHPIDQSKAFNFVDFFAVVGLGPAPIDPPAPTPPRSFRCLKRNQAIAFCLLHSTAQDHQCSRELLPCSSAAQAAGLMVSTGISQQRRRRGWTGALCTTSAAMRTCASSKLEEYG